MSEESLAAFVQILPFESLSFSSKRADGAFSGDWELLWVVDGTPVYDDVFNGINNALKIMNIAPIAANDIHVEALDDSINWLEVSYNGFEPFSAGRFFIHGAHFTGDMPDGQIPLEIDASIAFGSGEHGTTHGCLLLLEKLYDQGFKPHCV
ncbi:MAG: 50S ribosomal protein L11 methyltransferase, partial [Pseudomonadota bacterium]|nr:50S ribosomal protein L11 methyltransferase [Pseudomonadota bacterium]